MCWNAPVSLLTFLTSILLCGYIWKRNKQNDRPLSLWIACFSLMQLFEFFMWRDMKNHTLVSKISLIAVLAQPLTLAASLYYYNALKNTLWEKCILLGIIGIMLLKIAVAAAYALADKQEWLSVVGSNCHLVWWFVAQRKRMPWLARVDVFFYLSLFLGTLLIKPFKMALLYNLIGTLTLIVTRLFYTNETGSVWCWISNILALLTLARPYIMNPVV
jgi:hypothetical protein